MQELLDVLPAGEVERLGQLAHCPAPIEILYLPELSLVDFSFLVSALSGSREKEGNTKAMRVRYCRSGDVQSQGLVKEGKQESEVRHVETRRTKN